MTASSEAARGALSKPSVRGTQSFVGVMAEVWKKPSLTAIEIAWRWTFWIVFAGLVAWRRWPELQRLAVSLQAGGPFAGGISAASISISAKQIASLLQQILSQFCAVGLVWVALSAWGRGAILRRQGAGQAHFLSLFVLAALRVICFIAVLVLWVRGVTALTQRMVLLPQSIDQEPALVPFAAIVICGTLSLFVVWMAASYLFQLAPVICAEQHVGPWMALRRSLRGSVVRSKVIEVNLVIGIVKIALLVLAMVFSASPLPFSSVETQGFLTCWWIGVGVWYVIASDFVHVVRAVAFLRLWQVYQIQAEDKPQVSEAAS